MNYTSEEIEIKIEKLQEKLYEAYRSEWIDEHIGQEEYEKEREAFYEDEELTETYETFEDYIEDVGFRDGSLYVCFDEFLDYEYQDSGWRKSHLTAEENDFLIKYDSTLPKEKQAEYDER